MNTSPGAGHPHEIVRYHQSTSIAHAKVLQILMVSLGVMMQSPEAGPSRGRAVAANTLL